jgi:flagellar biosynthesis/type III secretory pathway chaperone
MDPVQTSETKNIEKLYGSLLELLGREVEVYREIRDVIIVEKQVLMKPSLEKLHEITSRKETWILKAKLLEEVRSAVVKQIALNLDLPGGGEEVTLSVLAAHAGNEKGEALRECQIVLRTLFENIQEMNQRNKSILDASLQSIRNVAAFVNDLVSPGVGYLGTGKRNILNNNGKLLCTEG